MESEPIFYDPHGKRRVRMSRFAAIVSSLAAVTSTVFALILCFTSPLLKDPLTRAHKNGGLLGTLADRGLGAKSSIVSKARKELEAEIARGKKKPKTPPAHVEKIVAGFYAPWEESGVHSLTAYKSHLTHLIPAWLGLGSDGKTVDFSNYDLDDNPKNVRVLEIAHESGLRIIPMISNSQGDTWDSDAVGILLSSAQNQTSMVFKLRDWVVSNKFQGINIDFEELHDADYVRLPDFIHRLRDVFRPLGLGVSVDIEADNDSVKAKELSDYADWVMLMAYDEHSEERPRGLDRASTDWCEKVVETALKQVPPDKLVMGIGNFAYDWGKKGTNAESLSFQEAMDTAKGYNDDPPSKVIHFDDESLNATFTYEDDDNVMHRVWMLDAASAYNSWLTAKEYDLRGAGVWALGEEDPGIWSFLGPSAFHKEMSVEPLKTVNFPYFVSNVGKGEILRVKDFPARGSRNLQTDADGLIVNEQYDSYPFPYVLEHSGYVKNELCLTFDDGPDPTYTAPILDALKDLKRGKSPCRLFPRRKECGGEFEASSNASMTRGMRLETIRSPTP